MQILVQLTYVNITSSGHFSSVKHFMLLRQERQNSYHCDVTHELYKKYTTTLDIIFQQMSISVDCPSQIEIQEKYANFCKCKTKKKTFHLQIVKHAYGIGLA